MIYEEIQISDIRLPIPGDEVLLTEFAADQGVLVDLNAKLYFLLNETALLIWHGLAKETPLSRLVDQLTSTYDVQPEEAKSYILKLVDDLAANDLVQ
jgi:hypothetical protein